MKTKTRTTAGKSFHRLDIHVSQLFSNPYDWMIVDFAYFRSHKDGKWTCRLKHIQENTCIKQTKTILATLNRLATKGLIYKEVEGTQPYKVGKGRARIVTKEKHRYTFYKAAFDKWLLKAVSNDSAPLRQLTQPPMSIDTAAVSNDSAKLCQKTLYNDSTRMQYKEKNKDNIQGASAAGAKLNDNKKVREAQPHNSSLISQPGEAIPKSQPIVSGNGVKPNDETTGNSNGAGADAVPRGTWETEWAELEAFANKQQTKAQRQEQSKLDYRSAQTNRFNIDVIQPV